MALDWQTFKSSLGISSGTSVFYIDDEGSKIPIDSECEFQEALRLARLNKNSLKFIFSGDKLKPKEMYRQRGKESAGNRLENCAGVMQSACAVPTNEGNVCNCHGDDPPEWFTHYMKKFKKEIVHELKSHIHDAVHSAIEEKLSCTKPEASELFCERTENPFVPVAGMPTKKKKKPSDLMDLIIDKRQLRLPKRFNATKPERLEMLDQKTKALLEEKRRLLESKHHSRSKEEKSFPEKSVRSTFPSSSEHYTVYDSSLDLTRESEFTVSLDVCNNGFQEWRSPELDCFQLEGVRLQEYNTRLPRLRRHESSVVELKGKLLPAKGPRYFKCRVVDYEAENIRCRFNVRKKHSAWAKDLDELVAAAKLRNTVGTLIDFEKDLITSSQKKIEENISEIERRLHDIELLQPSTCPDSGKGKDANAFQTGCDLIQLDSRPVQEDVKNECVGSAGTSGLCNLENDDETGKNEKGDAVEKVKKDGELESSDSELSIIFISKEEDDEEEEGSFFVVPSESLSSSESANEFEKSGNAESTGSLTNEQPAAVSQQESPKPEAVAREESNETSQASPTRYRFSPFGEDTSKPKKKKSKSTEYRFTADNLTQPTFSQTSAVEGRPSRFTFTGEKGEEKSENGKTDAVQDAEDALGEMFPAV